MEKPRYHNLYWRLTYGCNLHCFMCFGLHMKAEIVRGYEQKIFEQAKDLGFKTIVFTGGEPTLRKDLPELIHQARGYGFNVRLETNGVLVDKKYLKSIKDDLYILALPLHGSTADLHDEIVGRQGHFNIIKDRAKIAREFGLPLKITTAVTKKNIKDVEKIADYLAKEIRPTIYDAIAMVKKSLDCQTFNQYAISTDEFNVVKEKILKNNYPFKLSFCSGFEESDRAYIFINPDLSVNITSLDIEETIGDLKIQDLKTILAKARINYKLHLNRSAATSL